MSHDEQKWNAPESIEEFGEREWDVIHNALCFDASDRMRTDVADTDPKVSYLWDLADVIAEEKEVGHERR